MSLQENRSLFLIYQYGYVCLCYACKLKLACESSGKQIQQQNSAGVDPYSSSCVMKEIVEMELRVFKLTMNFRKTAHCERKAPCVCKNADWHSL